MSLHIPSRTRTTCPPAGIGCLSDHQSGEPSRNHLRMLCHSSSRILESGVYIVVDEAITDDNELAWIQIHDRLTDDSEAPDEGLVSFLTMETTSATRPHPMRLARAYMGFKAHFWTRHAHGSDCPSRRPTRLSRG